jgi:foldase protein PrsA
MKLKNVKKLICAVLIGVFAIGVVGCGMIEKTPEAVKGTVLAKVGKVNITREKLDNSEAMKEVITQLKEQYGENYTKNTDAMAQYKTQAQSYLQELVTNEILLQKANELKLIPDTTKIDEEVNKEIEEIKKTTFGGDQKTFEEGIKDYGYATVDVLKDEIKKDIIDNKDNVARNRVARSMVKDIKVTEQQMKDYYEAYKATTFTQKPGANLSHILVKTEQEAKDIKAKIDKGEKFEDMAKQYGTDATKDNGGELGYYAYDSQELVKEFMDGAKNLKEGEVSGPVKSEFGYHLIKATGINKTSKVQTYDEVKEQIKSTLTGTQQQEAYTKKLQEWNDELKVKTYEDKI